MHDRVQRRLTAILAADVVGYSRLMAADESGTLAALKSHRDALIDPETAGHGGRLVKLMGDGALVEFTSVVDAVECAIAIQRGMADRNRDVPEQRRIVFRIGINVGDIIIDGDDIYGDGVNIAARLEGLAPPGGICISGSAHEQVLGKVPVDFVDLGEQQVKNMERPIRAYNVVPDSGAAANEPAESTEPRRHLHDMASIAILPLTNMSGDPEQEYFADGITEDLITELSRFQNLSVIARNSTFTYKGKAVRVQDVGRELGVRYVVEGSIRKAGNRVRVSVQLVDAVSGSHLWAERYDRDLTDIFELQDELTKAIVATISGRLESAVAEGIKSKPPRDFNAYDCVMRAKLCHHRGSMEDNSEALRLLDTAIELDPGFAAAYGWKVCVLSQAWTRGYRKYTNDDYAAAGELIRRGISEDENDLECVRIICEFYMEEKKFDEAERYNEKAFRLNPNDPRIVAQRGELLTWRGRPEEGVEWVERAMQLDPFGADDWAHLLGRALFGAGRYGEALRAFKHVPRPRYGYYAFMAVCCLHLARVEETRALAAEVLNMKPDFSARNFVENLYYQDQADERRLLQGLLEAGLPS